MLSDKEFNVSIRRKLKNLSKNSPVFFKCLFDFKHDKMSVKCGPASYWLNIDRTLSPNDNVRQIYLTLFKKEYPRMEALDGNVYVIDKVNIMQNLILLKRMNDPDCDNQYVCKLKIPVVVFLRDYCSREIDITPIERWNIYVSNIGSVYRGDNIYGI